MPNPSHDETLSYYSTTMSSVHSIQLLRKTVCVFYMKVKVNNKLVNLVRIRNPWGNEVEWKGEWCDG